MTATQTLRLALRVLAVVVLVSTSLILLVVALSTPPDFGGFAAGHTEAEQAFGVAAALALLLVAGGLAVPVLPPWRWLVLAGTVVVLAGGLAPLMYALDSADPFDRASDVGVAVGSLLLLAVLLAGVVFPVSWFRRQQRPWGAAWLCGWAALGLLVVGLLLLQEGVVQQYAGHTGWTVAGLVLLGLAAGCALATGLSYRRGRRTQTEPVTPLPSEGASEAGSSRRVSDR